MCSCHTLLWELSTCSWQQNFTKIGQTELKGARPDSAPVATYIALGPAAPSGFSWQQGTHAALYIYLSAWGEFVEPGFRCLEIQIWWGESMRGSGPVLTGEMRRAVPCSIHRTWRELLCIFLSGAPQYAVAIFLKMTALSSSLLLFWEKPAQSPVAHLSISLGKQGSPNFPLDSPLQKDGGPWHFCPQGEAVAWISSSWDPESLPAAFCDLFALTNTLQSHLCVALIGKAGCCHHTDGWYRFSFSYSSTPTSSLDPYSPCNNNCECQTDSFTPVCGADGVTYLSACFAGCSSTVSAFPGDLSPVGTIL